MEYKIEKIISKNLFIDGIAPFGSEIGWSVYPIIYKGKKYVMDIRKMINGYSDYQRLLKPKIICFIYIFKYKPLSKLLKKQKGKVVYQTVLDILKTEDKEIEMKNMTEDELKSNLTELVKVIFYRYENNEPEGMLFCDFSNMDLRYHGKWEKHVKRR